MPSHQFRDRMRKPVMSKGMFLTYKQGVSLAVPGSRQATTTYGHRTAVRRIKRTLRTIFKRFAISVEIGFRELVLSNLVMTLYVTYAFSSSVLSPAVAAVTNQLLSARGPLKRMVDIVGSLLGLVLLSPLLGLIAIAIKLDSEGPVIFSQVRVGLNRRVRSRSSVKIRPAVERIARERRRSDVRGMPFRVYKFRSMVKDAEKKSGPIWATRNDPRITRVGSILRKTRLDEVPQLLNVLKGEMSLVGPRPERPVFIELLCRDIADYDRRLDVKPGITGLAQVVTGYDTSVSSVRAKVKEDLHYINSWSLMQDLKILTKTVIVVITGKGAF